MNTRLVMTIASLGLGITGVILTFIPDVVVDVLQMTSGRIPQLIIQIIGALYFAFAMLNWMSKGNLIGGIYNRPIAMANFTHYLVSGLAIIKFLISSPDVPFVLWVAGILYSLLAIVFARILLSHPLKGG